MTFCFILKLKITLFYFLSFVFICCTTPCHWLPFIIACYHSLSFAVTRCHSLSPNLSFVRCHLLSCVVTRCHLLYHSLLFVATRCHSLSFNVPLIVIRYHSLSLDVPLVCLFINNLYKKLNVKKPFATPILYKRNISR